MSIFKVKRLLLIGLCIFSFGVPFLSPMKKSSFLWQRRSGKEPEVLTPEQQTAQDRDIQGALIASYYSGDLRVDEAAFIKMMDLLQVPLELYLRPKPKDFVGAKLSDFPGCKMVIAVITDNPDAKRLYGVRYIKALIDAYFARGLKWQQQHVDNFLKIMEACEVPRDWYSVSGKDIEIQTEPVGKKDAEIQAVQPGVDKSIAASSDFDNPLVSNTDLSACCELIKNAKQITILGHSGADSDCVNACRALKCVLEQQGKTVEIIYPNEPKNKKEHDYKLKHSWQPDLIFICDTESSNRTYSQLPKEFPNVPIINIDHHEKNTIKGTYNFIDENASSTCEILACFIDAWNRNFINGDVSGFLLSGIIADSLGFKSSKTTARTMSIVSYLMSRGANLYEKMRYRFARDTKTLQAIGCILTDVRVLSPGFCDLYLISQTDLAKWKMSHDAFDHLVQFISDVTTSDITILAYEVEGGNTTSVQLRSKEFDVSVIAKKFGGGGHKHAAAFDVKKPLSATEKALNAEPLLRKQ